MSLAGTAHDPTTEIRDPLHGPIPISAAELAVVDGAAFERLRRIRQLGFGELTFPGATHTRYLHSLGAMHVAGRVFDAATRHIAGLKGDDARRLRALVRLAALTHDVGHPPLSHQLEHLLPMRRALPLSRFAGGADGRATHEDMSLLLLQRSDLRDLIETRYADIGITAKHVVDVIAPGAPITDSAWWEVSGRSALPLVRSLVSGELDCDRMDYLRRDAYFAGVSYGRYDEAWILSNLTAVDVDGHWRLGLDAKALFTFEDFLLARFHMFLIVYAHQRTMIYDRMLRAFLDETGAIAELPADPDAYLRTDDASVVAALQRHPENGWSRRIRERRPLALALEIDGDRHPDLANAVRAELDERGIEHVHAGVHTPLSTYVDGVTGPRTDDGPPLYIVSRGGVLEPAVQPVSEATELYARYHHTPRLDRIYVAESAIDAVSSVARGLVPEES